MAAAMVSPTAPPICDDRATMARTMAAEPWELAARAATSWQVTRVPPAKAMKIWHMMM